MVIAPSLVAAGDNGYRFWHWAIVTSCCLTSLTDILCVNLGGFGGHIDHDSHILSTLSAVQVLITYDRLDAINVDKVVDCKSEKQEGRRHEEGWLN